ncbi:ParB/RepB/Spo0J family partition protein [Mangrovibacterium marinum]|uniref:Chromosome segregation DNA-binding protein n=1 Tax=Mangrovibacterium marinum TaxID=1639118 RepID=A0A2T5C2B3_9BACT|nr:ParB/RepB/Spo0J family partition protein [Mangrovibacterium marinum]PTN08807.1 chromosome segregation DNA-binding protein [Mangrovibacterium marinum]
MAKRSALGRGLGALIDDADKQKEVPAKASINEIAVDQIEANPFQPRTNFDDTALQELAASIKELGIIQPITLRKVTEDQYQIIAGERRFRASKIAGLKTVPAYVRTAQDDGMLEMALVENIQREDLDAIEVALSYQRLLDECNLTQEVLSERVGKKRSTISNYLRLLKLPTLIQKGIIDKTISMGHARALVNIANPEDQLSIYELILEEDLSVRKVEEIVRHLANGAAAQAKTEQKAGKEKYPQEYEELKSHLSSFFSTKVDFAMNNKGKGKIVIPFGTPKDLERIMGILDKLGR